MDEALGGFDQIDLAHMQALYAATQGRRAIELLLGSKARSDAFDRHLHEYTEVLDSLYHAVSRASGSRVVVDSSKSSAHAFTLAEIAGIRPKMIHLIRDSRAVAHSWSSAKRRPDILDQETYMPRFNELATAVRWNGTLLLTKLAARRYAASTTWRYEDFAENPRQSIAGMLGQLEYRDPSLDVFVSDHEICLGEDHSLWGNPNRFNRGIIPIEPDRKWRSQMMPLKKAQVTLATLPGLIWYGYIPNRQQMKQDRSTNFQRGQPAG
jgi:hypothetical protein